MTGFVEKGCRIGESISDSSKKGRDVFIASLNFEFESPLKWLKNRVN